MKKTMFSAVAAILIHPLTLPVLAVDIPPFASVLTSGTSISCGRFFGRKISFTLDVFATRIINQAGMAYAEVEEYYDSAWRKADSASQGCRYNTKSHGAVLDDTGVTGREYRSVATFCAKDGIINESRTRVVSSITAIF